jgi:hypothetical protein
MPSDLQRVARGLVECLDEIPQVVAHLQRTAFRCRENAAMAVAASHGRATVAAQQLDAAARSCEEAAHYLAMAPPKAKAWAERLVGGSRSSNRPDAGSADRNKATGGVGDVAERDDRGRVKRTSAPLRDVKGNEPPLIKVARAALKSLRKRSESEEDQDNEEPLQVEVVVDPTGKAVVATEERDDGEEQREIEIKVERDTAATELLKAMEEHGKGNWHKAVLTIDDTRVTATFEYDDAPAPPEEREPFEAPVTDVEVPEPLSEDESPAQPAPIVVPPIDVSRDDTSPQEPAPGQAD